MIDRRTLLGATLASPALAGAAFAAGESPKEFRVGYQKSGVLVVARQQMSRRPSRRS